MRSVFDGRLAEQLGRLREWQGAGGGRHVVLLVEDHAPFQAALAGDPGRHRHFLKVMVQAEGPSGPL